MYNLYQWLKALLVLLAVGTVLSWLCDVPAIGWIACDIAIASLAISLSGFLLRLLAIPPSGEGSPADVDPELGGDVAY